MGFEGKIAIGIPHAGPLPGYFFDTFQALSKPGKECYAIRVENKPIDVARNLIVETALADPGITHVFFMDCDMQFPEDAMARLVLDQKPVVGGTYFARTAQPVPHVYGFHHEDIEGFCPLALEHPTGTGRWYRPFAKELAAFLARHPDYFDESQADCITFPATPDALVECDALGAGCMLIRREVLEAVGKPWFKCHENSGGGEDFWFCERAKAEGFSVWGDFAVQPTHELRHVWVDRFDFRYVMRLGEPDEAEMDIIVDVAPGAARPVTNPLVEEAG